LNYSRIRKQIDLESKFENEIKSQNEKIENEKKIFEKIIKEKNIRINELEKLNEIERRNSDQFKHSDDSSESEEAIRSVMNQIEIIKKKEIELKMKLSSQETQIIKLKNEIKEMKNNENDFHEKIENPRNKIEKKEIINSITTFNNIDSIENKIYYWYFQHVVKLAKSEKILKQKSPVSRGYQTGRLEMFMSILQFYSHPYGELNHEFQENDFSHDHRGGL